MAVTKSVPRFNRKAPSTTSSDIREPKIPLEAYDYCFFDEEGKPITLQEWCKYSTQSSRFRRENKLSGFIIRTYWTGVDMPHPSRLSGQYNFSRWTPNEPPQIFECNVYEEQNMLPVFRERYATRDEAYEGHSNLMKTYKEITV